jgi:hypothetical protein
MKKSTIALLAALGVVLVLALTLVLVGALTLRSRLQGAALDSPDGGTQAVSGQAEMTTDLQAAAG